MGQMLYKFITQQDSNAILALPDYTLLLGHLRVFSGHPSQEAGRASTLGTAHTHKVPRPDHVTRRLCRHFVGNHGVLADLLKDLCASEC